MGLESEGQQGSNLVSMILTIVLVLIVITAMLLFTDDVTIAEPRPELSWVNLLWSWSSLPLNFSEVMSPFAPLTVRQG